MAFGRHKHDDEAHGYYDDEGDYHRYGVEDFLTEDHRGRGRVAKTLGCLIPLALVGGLAYGGYRGYDYAMNYIGNNTCKVKDDKFNYQWSNEQTANASTIVDVGVGVLGMSTRAAQVAATTALQESKLRNLTGGDLDSLGLFQQRPSQGWGTAAQIQDPVYASTAFYQALAKVDGWESMSVTKAAQAVQKSGYPEAYADHETQGRVIADVFTGAQHEGVGCRLDKATSGSTAAEVVNKLYSQSHWQTVAASQYVVNGNPGSADRAWAIGSWAVAHAGDIGTVRVTVGNREWSRQSGRGGWSWHNASSPTSSGAAVRIELYSGS